MKPVLYSYLKLFGIILAVSILYSPCFSQTYRFKQYSIDNGLSQPYVYALTSDDDGYLWIGTGEGLCRFDGKTFRTFSVKDGLAENFITSLYISASGILWVGHNQGGISYKSGNKFKTVLSDTLNNNSIRAVVEDSKHTIWAVSQNGFLIRIDSTLEMQAFDIAGGKLQLLSMCITDEDNLLIGTDEGLYVCFLDENDLAPMGKQSFNDIPATRITSICKSKWWKNAYWVGSSDEGLFHLNYNEADQSASTVMNYSEKGLLNAGIENIYESPGNRLLVATFDGLYKMQFNPEGTVLKRITVYNTANGLPGDYVKTTFSDREGNIWLGLYGTGLAMLVDEYFTYYLHDNHLDDRHVSAVVFDGETCWVGLGNQLVGFKGQDDHKLKVFNTTNGLPDDKVTALMKFAGYLWIGTEQHGLYKMGKDSVIAPVSFSDYRLAHNINSIATDGSMVWVGTRDGLFVFDPRIQNVFRYTTYDGLVHNNISVLYYDRNGRMWAGAQGREIMHVNGNKIEKLVISDANELFNIVSITEDNDGRLWVGTYGSGIFHQSGKVFKQITSDDGLKSNYLYSLISGTQNDIWAGHRGGLSRIKIKDNSVEVFDKHDGISGDFSINAATSDRNGNLWFGSNKGLTRYNPEKYQVNNSPPAMNISGIWLMDEPVPQERLSDLPYSTYKIKIEYIGITFRQPENVRYQYMLEGYENSWGEFTNENKVLYPRLEEGDYVFHVRACNGDNICSDQDASLRISIARPFWKTWWFLVICAVTLISLVWLIIKMREARHKARQRELEAELELRTREVVRQKEELERKNRDITDSINYAVRIQHAILPERKVLADTFPESFIFYQPRDLVSGDFYWYRYSGNKFKITCADCTGHGVPGAFMSMIGSKTFTDIDSRFPDVEPGVFLNHVNASIKTTLKQDKTNESYDGMDAVFCNIDLDTKILSFAGAIRPLVHVRDGKAAIHRNELFSIGGFEFENKEFTTKTTQLQSGDWIYMFSDGIHDQFGGADNRKFTLKRLVALIEELSHSTAEKQLSELRRHLEEWSGSEDQIDDILLIGIKI